ncbi:MAG: ATP-binding protein [Phycisphaerae bacterium]|nr:ATP-binding protein [Phycisphaerae bacterium]
MFEIKHNDLGFELKMSATLENIDLADDFFADYLIKNDISTNHFSLRILLRESMLNAVTHGSDTDPDLIVNMEVQVSSDEIKLAVKDPGEGFPWQDKKPHFEVFEESGRGLALMHMYSDAINYNEKGNQVVITKKLQIIGEK